jgi:hypothetical protein
VSTQLEVGDTIPLQAQLDDGATGKTVHVDVFIPGNPPFHSQILSEVGNGLYQDLTQQMPDVPVVSAQYVVLNEFSQPSSLYGVDSEDFVRFKPVVIDILPPATVAAVVAEVSDETSTYASAAEEEEVLKIEESPCVTVAVQDYEVKTNVARGLKAEAEPGEIAVAKTLC